MNPPVALLTCCCVLLACTPSRGADWPQWRCDAGRSASSSEELPSRLHLQWIRQYAPRLQTWDDPLNNDKMTYDRVFEPVVLGNRLFVAFNDTDRVAALDIETGREVWTFSTNGPVRLPPAAWQGKVYFASDDGYLYCVAAETGRLVWKYRGGPSEQKVLGNRRVISLWPARGGPVVREGCVYFAAGIWPFLGTFLYALDAESGKVRWINDTTGAHYSLQPHGSAAFGGVAPQGALVATRDILLVPGGRSLPAAFDRRSGKFLYFHNAGLVGGKGTGGSFVCANERRCFVHTRLRGVSGFDLKSGNDAKLSLDGEPVLTDTQIYAARDRHALLGGPVVEASGAPTWELKLDGTSDLIRAGSRLYAAGQGGITAIELPRQDGRLRIAWTLPVEGQVERLLAAGGKLFAVTLDGRILAFGEKKSAATILVPERQPLRPDEAASKLARTILARSEAVQGYALCYGVEDGKLLEALLVHSELHIIGVDADGDRIAQLRRRFERAGLYGKRVALHQGDPGSFRAPAYLANLIVVGNSLTARALQQDVLEQIYRSVRPHGGSLWLPTGEPSLPGAELIRLDEGVLVLRTGALPGSAPWTHLYGDAGNTGKSNDAVVKLPLGILWFGGNSNQDTTLNPVAPPEQVIGGRLFVLGINGMSARDVYTGRVLWKVEFRDADLKAFGIAPSAVSLPPLTKVPTDPYAVGKVMDYHQCNTQGANFVATERWVYVARGNTCRVLDARTGRTSKVFQLPRRPGEKEPPPWGFTAVVEDVLLVGWGYAEPGASLDRTASGGLVALDKVSGKVLWQTRARYGFWHNGIVAGNGRVYCLDRVTPGLEERLRRRGLAIPTDSRLTAFELQNGKVLWEIDREVTGSWLSYSAKHDILLQAADHGPARIERRKPGRGISAHVGKTGGVKWQNGGLSYFGPLIIHDEIVLTVPPFYAVSSGAYRLLDGSPILAAHPLTGRPEPWRISRGYGCNSPRASQHLLTYRSGSAACYDLTARSGTASLGGFRSGCTSNLIVADGVLNAPDFTRHCTCTFQNQTSLALIHMPDLPVENWTCHYGELNKKDFFASVPIEVTERVRRVGINFGAPGDRQAENGTLWLDHPSVGGASYRLPVAIKGEKPDTLRRHEAFVEGALPWVTASCLRNASEISLDLDPSGKDRAFVRYTVRLYFAELEDLKAGQRVFDVAFQGKVILKDFDVQRTAGGVNRGIVREFRGVEVARFLRIGLTPREESLGAILSGVEVIAEDSKP